MNDLVNFRQEGRFYLAYFVPFRKLLTLNREGRDIVDCFFNKNFSQKDIVEFFNKSRKYKGNVASSDVRSFLIDVKEELHSNLNDGYVLPSNFVPSVPVSVELQINTRCNLRCKHCFQDSYSTTMHLKRIEEILKILKEANVFELNLVGGEVFLHPEFFKILELCVQKNFAINIVTNGTFLNNTNIEKLKNCKNIAVLVSLEGIGEINDMIRGDGIFSTVDKGIKTLIANGIYVEISNTLTAKNVDYTGQIFKYAEGLGIACNFNLFKPFKDTHDELVLLPEKYFQTGINIARNRETKSGLTNAAIMSKLLKDENRDECRATLLGLSIDVEGKMVPCVSLKEAGYYEGKVLPVFDENFLDVWKNDVSFREFRKIGFKECQARAYIFNKDVCGLDPYGIKSFEKYLKKSS